VEATSGISGVTNPTKRTERRHEHFRPACVTDSEAIADVYLASRKAFVAFAPLAHSDEQVREWVAAHLLPSGGVTVALRDGVVAGMIALSRDEEKVGWIDHLYLHPSAVGEGIGSQLVEQAKKRLGPPIRLFVFQENAGARRFYERHGFQALAFGDGSGNEENCPDALYEWTGDAEKTKE
jgi:ribosomal protein S18 acetylase RimI-like enzyme